jgi:predicted ATPase/class 3 adenylate cyclase
MPDRRALSARQGPELPSGTVTFLFTDIEGSTRLLHEFGDGYAEALAKHRRVLRAAFARHDGVEVGTEGDAFFVAFARASDALAAASEGQAGLVGPIRVRMGVHTGEPLLTDEGYVGMDVHRAARIAAAGHGGQVLVSQSTRDLAGADDLRDLGEHRLKDLTAAERIYQLGDGDFPPLKSLDHSNLPIAAGPMLGRKQELAEVLELLSNSVRLVTLVGPGGTGKTRLALQAAAELVPTFDDVWFVPLATLQDAELVLPTIAQTIGASGELAEHLRSRRTLLVLDNFEHLLAASASVSDLLGAADPVRVLATSRAPLRIAFERELPLDPLPDSEAAALFVERARAAGRRVQLDDVVRSVCRRVDRLPLAIELAAARTKLLDPPALLARLEQRLPMLTEGRRDAPARQRTLKDTIGWSYGLLDGSLQQVFRRLSVFAGFSLEAAEAVSRATIDDVAALADASLLKSLGSGRFLMLETIREFGADRLAEAGELDAVRKAHAVHFRDLAEAAQPHVSHGGAEQASWFTRLEEERDNLRQAIAYFRETERREDELRLVVAAYEFWWMHGYAAEARQYLDHALGADLPDPSPLAIEALEAAAYFAYLAHDDEATLQRAAQLLELASQMGDDIAAARALHQQALATHDVDQRRALDERALELFGADPGARYPLESLGIVALQRGDLRAARAYLERCVDVCRASGQLKDLSTAFILLALIAVRERDAESAADLLVDGAETARTVGDVSIMVWGRVWSVLAEIFFVRGEPERALRLLAAAERLRDEERLPALAGFTAELHETVKEKTRDALSPDRSASVWEEGRATASEEFLDAELRSLRRG